MDVAHSDVLVIIMHKWGDVVVTLDYWMEHGPGIYPMLRPIAAQHRETGAALPLEVIPLAYRNDAESLALIVAGKLDEPWGRPADLLRSISKTAADNAFVDRQAYMGDFLEEALPPLQPTQYAVYHVEVDSRIVLTTSEERFEGSGDLYLVFDSLADVDAYAAAKVATNPTLECVVVDSQDAFVKWIRNGLVTEARRPKKRPFWQWWRRK